MTIIGIDPHKSSITAVSVETTGKNLGTRRFTMNKGTGPDHLVTEQDSHNEPGDQTPSIGVSTNLTGRRAPPGPARLRNPNSRLWDRHHQNTPQTWAKPELNAHASNPCWSETPPSWKV